MSGRILLLRSGSAGPEDLALASDVTVLHTYAVEPRPEGVAEALAFDASSSATLVVSSRETVRVLLPLVTRPFALMVAVGEGTADLLRRVNTGKRPGGTSGGASTYSGAGALQLVVPEVPGAAGVLHLLRRSLAAFPSRILWPHGSDAASEPLEEIRSLGFSLVAPVVYSKRALSPAELDQSVVSDFVAGRFAAVAVGSTAGLDALLAAVPSPPFVKWGVLGPETAKALGARKLPAPLVPPRARLDDLLDLLRKETP